MEWFIQVSSRISIATLVFLAISSFMISKPLTAHAQINMSAIAKTYIISGNTPISGDLISFDKNTQTFHLSHLVNDPNLFGVVVKNPVVVLRKNDGGIPLVETGEALVNVTTINGPIRAGDYITTSSIPGKGQKVTTNKSFVLGTALDSFLGASTTSTTAKTSVYEGSIRVLISIGPKVLTSTASSSPVFSVVNSVTDISSITSKILKYLLAAVITIGTITIAFRNFGASLKDSVLSVGRNPLAKSSIQSMVVLNTILIVLVSAAGLFIGFAVLFLPI